MEYKILKNQCDAGVAVLTISRPAALNALNSEFFTEFNLYLDQLESDPKVRVLVITGEGKSFVAGADIAEMAGMNPVEASAFSVRGQRTFDRLGELPFPVIAAVNGYALGGGCELAMACDFRIASAAAKFGQPELNLGLIPGYAGTQRLPRLSGVGNALWLILTAETITADDALRIGLVQKVFTPETLMEETMKIASRIASNGSRAVKMAKEVIRRGTGMDFNHAQEYEAGAFSSLFGDPATREGMKAFLEKRKPAW